MSNVKEFIIETGYYNFTFAFQEMSEMFQFLSYVKVHKIQKTINILKFLNMTVKCILMFFLIKNEICI